MASTMSSLLKGLREYVFYPDNSMFQAKWNTDLTICCQDKEFHVHKIILGMQSEFFRKACDPESPFKESRTGVITLPEDDAFLVRILLVYCYTGELDESCIEKWCQEQCRSGESVDDDAFFTVQLYSLAEKYQVSSVKKAAKERFQGYLQDDIWMFPEGFDYFPVIAREVYRTTPGTDRGLRDLILSFASQQLQNIMGRGRFRAKIDKIEGFWGELHLYQFETGKRKRVCPGSQCKKTSSQSFPRWMIRRKYGQDASLCCPYCKVFFPAATWNRPVDDDYELGSYKDSSDEEEASGPSNKRKRLEGSPELGTTISAAKSR